jgi:lipid II:glycine glycyltransferase (peptidoglycan interpeptide bridge formation enzyme)
MYLHVREKINAPDWNIFVVDNGPASGAFLQSWEWGEVLRAQGRDVQRIAQGLNGEGNRAQCSYESTKLTRSISSMYIPRGPIGLTASLESGLIEKLIETEKRSSTAPIFIRAEFSRDSKTPKSRLTHDVQPSTTLITDLSQKEDDLLSAMHQKTRYNIRLAKKKEVEVSKDGYVGIFIDLVNDTARRHGVRFSNKKHYKSILKVLDGNSDAPKAFLAQAKHGDDVLAMALCIDFGKTRTYLHGASSETKKNMMAPYLLHWELMNDAKESGLTSYDWWGIAPEESSDHKLAGVTRFKKGFGGKAVSFPKTQDFVLSPLYYSLYRLMKIFR